MGLQLAKFVNGMRWYASALPYLRFPARGPLHIVTGADTSHFEVLLGLLQSIRRYEPDASVAVWDLGLSDHERVTLSARFPEVAISTFDYSRYPDFFDIRRDAGGYAWKPTLFVTEVLRQDRVTLWLDAGDLLTGRLSWIRRFTRGRGFYSVFSDGNIAKWTHPTVMRRLLVDEALAQQSNLASGLVAVDPQHAKGRALIQEWAELSLDQEAIAPIGSSKANHRQDQALLTVLAHRAGLFGDAALHMRTPPVHVLFHRDQS